MKSAAVNPKITVERDYPHRGVISIPVVLKKESMGVGNARNPLVERICLLPTKLK